MTERERYTPPGYGTMSPHLSVEGSERLFEFLERSFDGEVDDRTLDDAGVTAPTRNCWYIATYTGRSET